MGDIQTIASFLLPVIAPVVGLVVLGGTVVRIGVVDNAGVQGITNLVFWFLLPAFLFLSVYNNPVPNALGIIGLYFAVALPVFGMSILVSRLLLKLTIGQAAVFALNAVYGNSVMLGIPIVGTVWAGPGLNVLLAIVAVHSLILLPITSALVEIDDKPRLGILSPVFSALKNPIISSIIAAVALRWIGFPIPRPIYRILELLSQRAPSISLICLGATLPPLGRAAFQPYVIFASAIKLVGFPLVMAAVVIATGVPMPAAAVMVFTAALPTGANAFLLARRADTMIEASAATVVVATLLAVLTLSVALALLR